MISVVALKNVVRVHTGINKVIRDKVRHLSATTRIPQEVIYNTVIAKGLKSLTTTSASASVEVTKQTFKKPTRKLAKGKTKAKKARK